MSAAASPFEHIPCGIGRCGLRYRRICEAKQSRFSRSRREKSGLVSSLAFLLLFTAVVEFASAQTKDKSPNVVTIVARMTQARAENQTRLRPYIVTRAYKLFGEERVLTKAQVIANVSFVPPNSKQYAIEQAKGTGLGKRIVRRVLETETKVVKDHRSTDFSHDNYDFRLDREEEVDGHLCYVIELLPLREEKHLLRGMMWVDSTTYLPRRVVGGPAKSPSWWLRDVRIVLIYSDVEGMWLQTASESTANVRILGLHTMESHDVNYEIRGLVVTGLSATTSVLRATLDESSQDHVVRSDGGQMPDSSSD